MTSESSNDIQKYLRCCRTEFWQKAFRVELDYLVRHLGGSRDILSVGCGPAVIETGLSERGFHVTGLDISREALVCAPDRVRTVVARAEDMSFPDLSFDAVIFAASLQFIEDYGKAIAKAACALRPEGKLLVMLLNPESIFFKEKAGNPASYVRHVKHINIEKIERAVAGHFHVQTEYLMGVSDGDIFESREPGKAALYVIRGTRKESGKEMTA